MKSAIFILAIVSALFLGACSQRELLVYAAEPYWESANADGLLGGALSSVARARGLRLRLVNGGINDSVNEVLSRELSRARAAAAQMPRSTPSAPEARTTINPLRRTPLGRGSTPPEGRTTAVVVADPLSSAEAADLAPRFPSVLFILMGDAGGDPRENIIRLLFDREPAFRTAGHAAGLALGGAKAGVILGGLRNAASADVAAFTSGLKDAGHADRLVIRDLGGAVDAAAVQRAVNEMRAGGVEIFLPKLGEQNQACLDAVRASGGCVVTEDWRATKAFEEQVFLSVEEDVAGGIDACLSAATQRPQTVYGPVRLACGKARDVPPELRDKITCR